MVKDSGVVGIMVVGIWHMICVVARLRIVFVEA